MDRAVQSRGRTLGLAALSLLVLATTVSSQDPLPVRIGAGTTLYLVVRTKPNVPEKRITDTLNAGLSASLHTIDGKPTIKPVSPLFFEQFAELIGTPARKVDTVSEAGTDKLGVKPLPSRDVNVQELRLPTAKQTLTKLKVDYVNTDGKTESEEYVPQQPGDSPLTLIEPGRYAFRPSAGKSPKSYVATYDERDESSKKLVRDKTLTGDWPQTDKFYVVTMKNFRRVDGNPSNHESFLSAVERQTLNTANPINITRLGGDQLFVFADMAGGGADTRGDFDGNNLVFRIPGPNMRNTRRVWVLFPLSKDQYETSLEKYKKFPTTDFPAEVRKNAVTAQQDATTGKDTTPRWVELSPDPALPGTFTRAIPLRDLPELASKYPDMGKIVMYEFEGPDGAVNSREAIEVKNEKGDDVTVLGSPIASWSRWASELRKDKK
jgi:hypothetical protein